MKTESEFGAMPLPQEMATATTRRHMTVGLPASNVDNERRFPLTPEGAGLLVAQGFTIKMESGAGDSIHYTDNAYSREGTQIVSRSEALGCDIVLHLAPLSCHDIRQMRRGAVLLSLLSKCNRTKESVKALMDRNIINVALDLVEDRYGNTPFADILSEIDGRAALAVAGSLLADSIHGKGILLGGVAGVIPCETTVIGSGISACAAARAASGAGSTVRIFDNDVYRLREATKELGTCAVGSALHPRVLRSARPRADVVVFTQMANPPVFDTETVSEMKKGVIIFDLTNDCGSAFPSLPTVDLALASPSGPENVRCCYVHAGSAVPRTAAMALSNTLLTFMNDISASDGVLNALKMHPGIRKGAVTFMGKIVNAGVAETVGMRSRDIAIFLTLS
ncbi:MAG: hypothetical protein K2H84_00090 [Paramuribaculum sp.]|nr:hypothetical protein [Paramuribaculum sp.]